MPPKNPADIREQKLAIRDAVLDHMGQLVQMAQALGGSNPLEHRIAKCCATIRFLESTEGELMAILRGLKFFAQWVSTHSDPENREITSRLIRECLEGLENDNWGGRD